MKLSHLWTHPLCADPPSSEPSPQPNFSSDLSWDSSGLAIGQPRNRSRLTLFPDGSFRRVDHDFDSSVFKDPDSVPIADDGTTTSERVIVESRTVPEKEATSNNLQSVALAMLDACPASLIAIAHDAKGTLIGATVTKATKGITPAVFRAAFRSLPERCKQVTFAARSSVSSETRDAATVAAESFLVRVMDFITTS